MAFEMDGYVTVAERINQLKAKYPEAVLRPYNPAEPFTIRDIGGKEFIVYVAACYRTPTDPMPAVAVAIEPCVPKSNFTKDSMVMNAETSAWGRCIMAALACDTSRGVASLDEVRSRKQDEPRPESHPSAGGSAKITQIGTANSGTISQKQIGLITKLMREKNMNNADLMDIANRVIGRNVGDNIGNLSSREGSRVISELMTPTASASSFPQDEEPF